MRNRPSLPAAMGILVLVFGLAVAVAACKDIKKAAEALEFEEPAAEAEPEPAEIKPAAPAPKITEPVYVEIMARTALIWEKYKDAPAEAEQAVEAVARLLRDGAVPPPISTLKATSFPAESTLQPLPPA